MRSKFFVIILLIIICIFSIFYFKKNKSLNEVDILTNAEYVQSTFPNIEKIKNTKYYYRRISNDREIGLVRADYCGVMEIETEFSEKLKKEYEWESVDISKDIVDNLTLLGEDYKNYTFLYSDEFCNDGKYVSHSMIGKLYFDPINKIIYFQMEFS